MKTVTLYGGPLHGQQLPLHEKTDKLYVPVSANDNTPKQENDGLMQAVMYLEKLPRKFQIVSGYYNCFIDEFGNTIKM